MPPPRYTGQITHSVRVGYFFCRASVLKKRERGFGVVGQQTASSPGQEANFRFLDLKFSVLQRVGTSFRGRKQRLFL